MILTLPPGKYSLYVDYRESKTELISGKILNSGFKSTRKFRTYIETGSRINRNRPLYRVSGALNHLACKLKQEWSGLWSGTGPEKALLHLKHPVKNVSGAGSVLCCKTNGDPYGYVFNYI